MLAVSVRALGRSTQSKQQTTLCTPLQSWMFVVPAAVGVMTGECMKGLGCWVWGFKVY